MANNRMYLVCDEAKVCVQLGVFYPDSGWGPKADDTVGERIRAASLEAMKRIVADNAPFQDYSHPIFSGEFFKLEYEAEGFYEKIRSDVWARF